MKIYRYWNKVAVPVDIQGESRIIACHGWSDTSLADAAQRAREIAERCARAVERGGKKEHYAYLDRPIREEIIKEITRDGRRTAVITRNSYGSLILNTAEALFVDIDYLPEGLGIRLRRFLLKLMGKPIPRQDEGILSLVHGIVEEQRGMGLRVYRTANGFRCLVTNRTYDPVSQEVSDLLERFGGDPLYSRLCKSQECFRARLTPKFWRCQVPRPPSRFPWANPEEEARYRDWELTYQERTNFFATCMYVAKFGSTKVHESIRPIVSLHDRYACTGAEKLA